MNHHCSKFTNAEETEGLFGGGTITITAANGDQLFMTEDGAFHLVFDDTGAWSIVGLDWDIIGGTGRFTGADGAGTGAGVADLMVGTTSAHFTGWITYDASARAMK